MATNSASIAIDAPVLQPRLAVQPAGDAHEEEADRVADQLTADEPCECGATCAAAKPSTCLARPPPPRTPGQTGGSAVVAKVVADRVKANPAFALPTISRCTPRPRNRSPASMA